MKKAISLFITATVFLTAFAQNDPSATAANNYHTLPEFQVITVPDSSLFSGTALPKNKPVVIIMFNPDCDHCQKETKELLAWRQEIKDLPIVMVSASPYDKVKAFYEEYNIASMANIKMGCDIKYNLVLKFRASTYPAIYVYDKKGTLAKAYVGGASIPAILDAVKE